MNELAIPAGRALRGGGPFLAAIPVVVEGFRFLRAREERLQAESACRQARRVDRKDARAHERFLRILDAFLASSHEGERDRLLSILERLAGGR